MKRTRNHYRGKLGPLTLRSLGAKGWHGDDSLNRYIYFGEVKSMAELEGCDHTPKVDSHWQRLHHVNSRSRVTGQWV